MLSLTRLRPVLVLPLLALVALLMLPAGPAAAFRLIPIEREFAPSGRGATQIFEVQNDAAEPVAIDVQVLRRRMDETGQDVLEDAYDDWIVFPEQIILQPNERQSIRVQYAGTPNPDREVAYRLIADQLPIDIGRPPAQGGQVRLLVRYVASIYVVPPGVAPDLAVQAVQPIEVDGKRMLEVVVQNRGTQRQVLRDAVLTVKAGTATRELSGEALEGLTGENILAGTTRRFRVPLPAGLSATGLTAELKVP